MRQDPLFTVWLVRCPSPEDALRILQWLPDRIGPEATFVDDVRPPREGDRSAPPYRIGDYFENVRLLPGPGDSPASFRILFQRRPEAGRFWKDLMLRVLQSVRGAANATTTLDYRGDEEPETLAAGP